MADIPPGPWTWRRVRHPAGDEDTQPAEDGRGGEALVAGDETWLLGSRSTGGGAVVHPALRQLLPLLAPDAVDLDGAVVEAEVAVGLLAEVRRLTAERDQARGLAWSYEHRLFNYAQIGIELAEDGEPLEPAWLSSPVAPYEAALDADLARFAGSGYGTVYGEQVAGLAVGDCFWVTGVTSGDADTVYAQVREVGNGWVHAQLLTEPTDVRPPP